MKNPVRKLGQAGFTLIEILVALILVSLLVAAVFPMVTQQARQAEAPRLATDLTNIKSGVELFNVNLRNRFPERLADLTKVIHEDSTALGELDYTPAHVDAWDGPYIDAVGDSIVSGFDAVIDGSLFLYQSTLNRLATGPMTGATADSSYFVALSVSGLDATSFERLNSLLDGASDTTSAGHLTGNLRALSADPADAYYLAVPFRR